MKSCNYKKAQAMFRPWLQRGVLKCGESCREYFLMLSLQHVTTNMKQKTTADYKLVMSFKCPIHAQPHCVTNSLY